MATRWFADPPAGRALDGTVARLVGEVARLLERLRPPALAPGEARVDPEAGAVVLPHRGVPGCALVVQVAEWSASVGCWWSAGPDPLAGPVRLELSAEFPLRPDGLERAVAWLEAELTRPVVERAQVHGVARHRQWSLVLDDGAELAVRDRWQPAWWPADTAPAPPDAGPAPAGATRPPVGWWLLAAAVAAALAHWGLVATTSQPARASWLTPVPLALKAAAFAALLAWFWVAARGRPARVRAPMLAGLLLATLGAALQLLPGPADLPTATDPAPQVLGQFLREAAPRLLGVAALACYLAALLGLPGATAPRRPWPRALPALAGLGWGIDVAVSLQWLASIEPTDPAEAVPVWYWALGSALQAVGLGLAILLLFVVLERRPAMAWRAARAGLAGGIVLLLAWSVLLQLGSGMLVLVLPDSLAFAVFGAATGLGFAGAALLAVAAAEPTLIQRPAAPAPA